MIDGIHLSRTTTTAFARILEFQEPILIHWSRLTVPSARCYTKVRIETPIWGFLPMLNLLFLSTLFESRTRNEGREIEKENDNRNGDQGVVIRLIQAMMIMKNHLACRRGTLRLTNNNNLHRFVLLLLCTFRTALIHNRIRLTIIQVILISLLQDLHQLKCQCRLLMLCI